MYTLTRTLPLRTIMVTQAPVIAGSMIIAELFYKFHSFTLECIAFLATWFVLDAVQGIIRNQFTSHRSETSEYGG